MTDKTIIIKETKNCFPIDISLDGNGDMDMIFNGRGITLDIEQAKQFLPILEHYINTGELLDSE